MFLQCRIFLSTKILQVHQKCKINFGTPSNCFLFFQYCESNNELLSIAPHLIITLPTLRQQKLSLLISLLNFLYCFFFIYWVMASFLYCSPYCIALPNFAIAIVVALFWLLKAVEKSTIIISHIECTNNIYVDCTMKYQYGTQK